jgi:hypothetical protein
MSDLTEKKEGGAVTIRDQVAAAARVVLLEAAGPMALRDLVARVARPEGSTAHPALWVPYVQGCLDRLLVAGSVVRTARGIYCAVECLPAKKEGGAS